MAQDLSYVAIFQAGAIYAGNTNKDWAGIVKMIDEARKAEGLEPLPDGECFMHPLHSDGTASYRPEGMTVPAGGRMVVRWGTYDAVRAYMR